MNIKKMILISLLVVIIAIMIIFVGFNNIKNDKNEEKMNIVVTSFSTYDFVKHIVGDKANVEFLLGPGIEAHGYEPTAQDLIKIQNSDMFIYIGGEMESWSEKTLDSLDMSKVKVICLLDTIDKIEEQEVDGAEAESTDETEKEEIEYYEHIWTSPANSIIIMSKLEEEISKLDSENKIEYQNNSKKYIEEIKNVKNEIQKIVDSKIRSRLVFGDKMPMQYFLNEFALTASAAFNGCSTETEPSSSTIAYLINKVNEEKIPVILYIELSSGKVAKTIAEETGTQAVQIQSLHNVSKDDFNNGETYVSLMKRNLEVLKKALQ